MKPTSTDCGGYDSVGNGTNPSQRKECLELLQTVLDDQATVEQTDTFVEHLKKCMPCYENYNIDRAIKDLVQAKCCNSKVPLDLADSIRSLILHQVD